MLYLNYYLRKESICKQQIEMKAANYFLFGRAVRTLGGIGGVTPPRKSLSQQIDRPYYVSRQNLFSVV